MGTLGKRWKNSYETITNRVNSRKQGAGFSPSPETRTKISAALTGRKIVGRKPNYTPEERRINDRKNQYMWAKNNPDKIRISQVRYRYNLTPEKHQDILQKQNFKCAFDACPASVDMYSPVDHNHACCPGSKSCGKCIRGILCNRHNVGLAHFQDNISELFSATEYLDKNSHE